MANSINQYLTEQLIGPQDGDLDAVLRFCQIVAGVRDVHQLIDRVGQHLIDVFDTDLAVLLVHDPQSHQFWTHTKYGPGDWPKIIRVDDDEGLCGHVRQTHETFLIGDSLRNMLFSCRFTKHFDDEPRSIMAVGVFGPANQFQGVLEVMDQRVDQFNDADRTLLKMLAVPLGLSLDHARNHEGQRRQFDTLICAFVGAIDARDAITKDNSINVANYAMGIGKILGLDARHIESLRVAALLQDVGKIGTPDRVLTKAGRLEGHEFEEVKKHARYTRQILSQVEFTEPYGDVPELASAHHEKLDGSGYPDGLVGNQVPLKARILTVADMFHALTQPRHYRAGMDLTQAITVLDELVPEQLDARCVAALKAFLGIGPMPMPAA